MYPEKPVFRRLRVFALDPGATANMETAVINEAVLSIPWEDVDPGPVGEYVAVIDKDETGRRLHEPVNLNRPELLANDGLAASDGNPQFRQQMLYAVAMRTIDVFERSLGRRVQWAPLDGKFWPRIEMYPHYLKDANAYFDPPKGRMVFGYFPASPESRFPGMAVFTCLSQDVIAHELTHPLLLGMHARLLDSTNPDVYAFQEGFCDLVALLQHFSLPELLRHQLAQAKGNLMARSQLGILGQQFGDAVGMKSGLRSALGEFDANGVWKVKEPDPLELKKVTEPHARGAILVRAVFDAFQKIYQSRVAGLLRIATNGSGILPDGHLHPDLVNRLSQEAAKSARHVLDMCVRALDYCPAVDITFGDYLRAIITADFDLERRDDLNYRMAFVEAFRRHGIFPHDVSTLSVETLLWPQMKPESKQAKVVAGFVARLAHRYSSWNLPRDRRELFEFLQDQAKALEKDLKRRKKEWKGLLGDIDPEQPFEVHNIFPRQRIGPKGEPLSQWVIELVQSSGTLEYGDSVALGFRRGGSAKAAAKGGERFRSAGCTLLVDADSGEVRYIIAKSVGVGKRKKRVGLLDPGAGISVPPPFDRRLRVFAFDPSLSTQIDTAGINEVIMRVPWEPLEKGPAGEYLEVVDRDPATGCFYEPVDLNHPYVLAQDGLSPSQGNPQFHQEMVYTVAMSTIRNFERALGRLALWSPRRLKDDRGRTSAEEYVGKLRLYPHALREANAYYSPAKKAVLFGYFPTSIGESGTSVTVFTCLSHDIIAHEVTHALLDGMHRRFAEPSNADVLAFHEAFADLVALFQHFSLPRVLEHQIAATRGDLASQSRLGELAQEFGSAIGKHGALRNAIGEVDPKTGQWRPRQPDPEAYQTEFEPHARGALLVAAVFDAFLTLYRSRVADLLRIATQGTGVLPAGSLHPDLVQRLAAEAAKSAQRVLDMCIRALDYCPPVDITFGDYLRAIITADDEYDPMDQEHRRVAFIDAFRRHGILPADVRTISVEGLLWRQAKAVPDVDEEICLEFMHTWTSKIQKWSLSRDRREVYELMRHMRQDLHRYLVRRSKQRHLSGFDPALPFEVHSLRPSSRVDWRGESHFQWVIELTQRIPEFFAPARAEVPGAKPDYYFRGGTTLLVDADTCRVRYAIRKRLDSRERRENQRSYMTDVARRSLHATYFRAGGGNEPFAALHRF